MIETKEVTDGDGHEGHGEALAGMPEEQRNTIIRVRLGMFSASGRAIGRRRLLGIGIVGLVVLGALSTYNAVTTDRFVIDLPMTRLVQRFGVRESLEQVLFFGGVEGVAGAIMFLVLLWQWSRRYRVDAIVLLLTLVPNGATFLLRALVDRPRPIETDLVNVLGDLEGASYPSGHAVLVVLLYGFLLYLLPTYTRYRPVIYSAWALFLVNVLFSGLGLIHRGRHWPSDVFGGYLYGLLFLLIWIWLHHWVVAWERRYPDLLAMTTLRRLTSRLRAARGS